MDGEDSIFDGIFNNFDLMAAQVHEMFVSFVEAGFTEDQALSFCAKFSVECAAMNNREGE